MTYRTLNMLMAASALIGVAGCNSTKLNSACYTPINSTPAEMQMVDMYKTIERVLSGDAKCAKVGDALYVRMPNLDQVAAEHGIDLSKAYLTGMSFGDGVRMIWNDKDGEHIREQIIAADRQIETPWGYVTAESVPLSKVGAEVEKLAGHPVEVSQYDPYSGAGNPRGVCTGSIGHVNPMTNQSGCSVAPIWLNKMTKLTGMMNARWYAVVIPTGNQEVDHVIAVADADKVRIGAPKENRYMGNNWTVVAVDLEPYRKSRDLMNAATGWLLDATAIMRATQGAHIAAFDFKEGYLPRQSQEHTLDKWNGALERVIDLRANIDALKAK